MILSKVRKVMLLAKHIRPLLLMDTEAKKATKKLQFVGYCAGLSCSFAAWQIKAVFYCVFVSLESKHFRFLKCYFSLQSCVLMFGL